MSTLTLHCIDHDRRMARFYQLDAQRSLIGALLQLPQPVPMRSLPIRESA